VPILALLDYAYVEDYSLAYYGVHERVIILWYYATDYTVVDNAILLYPKMLYICNHMVQRLIRIEFKTLLFDSYKFES
jgi:hypothetical protein